MDRQMRNWNTTRRFGPFMLKSFRGVAARDRYKNELETLGFLQSRGIAVPSKVFSSAQFTTIAYARVKGLPLTELPCRGESIAVLHDAADQLAHRTGLADGMPLGWLHRPNSQSEMISVFRADLERIAAASQRLKVEVNLRDEIDLLTNMQPSPVRTKMLCLADFSPKNLLVDGRRWTVVDLESSIVAPSDVFWAKAAVNTARDIGDPSVAVQQALWFWRRVVSETVGTATIVWALARMLHFRAVVGGPAKDPTPSLEGVRRGHGIHAVLAALANA